MKARVTETGGTRTSLKVLVVGATGGTGRATVERLIREGHHVTAFSRSASALAGDADKLTTIEGDVTNMADIERAVSGQDVVIVTLGISENPLRVRFFGAARTSRDVRSVGTCNVIAAMRKHGVKRLVVQSSYGVDETRERLGLLDRLFFRLILKPQIDDTAVQEEAVRASDVDWVLVQPVHLSDDQTDAAPFVSTHGETRVMKVARRSVARFLAIAAREPDYVGRSVAVSG